MASNPYVNKVNYGGTTIIDLTSDDVSADYVASGKYFHLPTGERVQGTASFSYDATNEELTVPSWAVTIE